MATAPRIALRAVKTMYGTQLPTLGVPEKAGAAFKVGAPVVGTAGFVDECGADPVSILGIATKAGQLGGTDGAKTNTVHLAAPGTLFVGNLDDGAGSQVSAVADRFKLYGIAKHAGTGKWYVDKTDTTATRVRIWEFWDEDAMGDTMARVVFCFLTANFQGHA
jgi:hypothetical protein